jgi:hypothetical protein
LDPDELRQFLEKYQRNKALIEGVCRQFSVTPIFVWQPVPDYKYDMRYHLFTKPNTYRNHVAGYSEMAKLAGAGSLGTNFLWCADIQEHEKECVYVDVHHYTARFAKKFAEIIFQMCVDRGLLRKAGAGQAEP